MKRKVSILLIVTLVLSLIPFSFSALAASDPLAFDIDAAYIGRYTVNGNTTVPGVLVFDSYQVTYVANPTTFPTAASIQRMNIKVPVSYDGVLFDEADIADAPMLMYNPWGMDNGSAPPSTSTVDAGNFNVKRIAMAQGWVLVEPGMRGQNATVGTVGAANYYNYGKLPYPIVDLKAAIRYLRHGNNPALIPGDEEKIIFTGFSSGGCATTVIGASGNTHEYDEYLIEMGAAMDARDDVFAAAAGCPVITRDRADQASYWMVWGTDLPADVNPYNQALTNDYQAYQDSLNLVGTAADGVTKVAITDWATYTEFIMGYIKRDLVKFLNHISTEGTNNAPGAPGTYITGMNGVSLTGRAAIDAYLASTKPRDSLYGTPRVVTRDWIVPIFDPADPGHVIDVDITYQQYLDYIIEPGNTYVSSDMYEIFTSTADRMTWSDLIDGNGAVQSTAAPSGATTRSLGLPTDYAALGSDFAWMWLETERGIVVPEEYRAMIRHQRNAADPQHWLMGYGGPVDVAQNWFIRNGGNDLADKLPNIFNVAIAAEMLGKNVDIGIAWDQGHAYTNDVVAFFKWANAIVLSATPEASVTKLSGNQNQLTVTITEVLLSKEIVVTTLTFMIDNNSAGVYTVGDYKVYVDTKGNDQIRACYIVQ